MYKYLDKVDKPSDIKGCTVEQLNELCGEIRDYMVQCCSRNPGHLASSLGAVEIITGLHYVYDAPEDQIVFDVGHQAYAHKILTGRREAFRNNRTHDGISGFPRREESGYDAFGVGHSSTSISAALGLAEAARMQGRDVKTVAVIGDGALTGGMAYEALNNAGDSDLLLILNDNNQSIDRNLGGVHNHLLKLITSRSYNRVKDIVWKSLGETRTRGFFQRWVRSLKSWFVKRTGGDLFESLGLRYFGPIDGNDIADVVKALGKLKDLKGPRVLHCVTVNGKGYAPAEADPTIWHAPGKFNPETGERIVSPHPHDRYQDVFGQVLCELAASDPRVVGVTPAMASGCGMSKLAKEMPDRFHDVGIEEEHAVTFSAGLAAGGMRPFCNIYSSFSQRAYDQVIHDVALQGLPVVLCLDRAGLVGEDGATHHGAFDMAAFRSIPGLSIIAPRNETELKRAMYTGLRQDGPYIIRYPRGMGEGSDWRNDAYVELPSGRGEKLLDGRGIAILSIGPVAGRAVEAAMAFGTEGEMPAVYDMRYLKPIDTAILDEVARNFKAVLTLEDGALKGGLYSEVCEYMSGSDFPVIVEGLGIPDRFIIQGTQKQELEECGLSKEGILAKLRIIAQKNQKSFGE